MEIQTSFLCPSSYANHRRKGHNSGDQSFLYSGPCSSPTPSRQPLFETSKHKPQKDKSGQTSPNWEIPPVYLGVPKLGCFKRGCLQCLRGLRSFAPFCALFALFFALFCGLVLALICALLRTLACLCVRPRLERPHLGIAENKTQKDKPNRDGRVQIGKILIPPCGG